MGYLYRKSGKPSIEKLQRAASLFGCSVTEFVDDPGAEIEGLVPGQGLSETKRLVAKLILKELMPDDVSDEQALAYLQVVQTVKQAGRHT